MSPVTPESTESNVATSLANADFLARMGHELRTPLNGILGFAQLMELESLSERQQESLQHILTNGWQLLGLINDVIDLTRVDSGKTPLSPEPVRVCDVLEESMDLIQPLARQHEVHLLAETLPGCDVHVLADRQRLKQISINLLTNAVKYSRKAGDVRLACRTARGTVFIDVADTGIGVTGADVDRVFAPFEHISSDAVDAHGPGIGLMLSKRLAEAMGGTLTVIADDDVGSTFTLGLPAIESPVERFERLRDLGSMPGQGAPASPSRTRKVLHIEDNLSNLRLVQRVLHFRDDIEIIEAMQGGLGVELARHHLPDVVLLDLHLPDVDGLEILRQLRHDESTMSIPVIVISAGATPAQVDRLRASGAYGYLLKPLEVPELMRLLSEILGGSHAA
ncbi:MAG TPA: ATP-binding protein [Ilumatobacteraceae bacterium]